MAVSPERGVQLARNESDMNWSSVGPTRWHWPLTCLWPWPWIFKVQFSNCFISGRDLLGKVCLAWNERDMNSIDTMLDPVYNFEEFYGRFWVPDTLCLCIYVICPVCAYAVDIFGFFFCICYLHLLSIPLHLIFDICFVVVYAYHMYAAAAIYLHTIP